MVVDQQGRSVGCDLLLAWMVGPVLAEHRGASIVYDLRSSRAVREAIEHGGGTPVQSRVGHVFMKAALRESQAPIGGELSGHFYFQDHFGTDSGARAFIEVCNLLADGGRVSEAIATHDRYARSGKGCEGAIRLRHQQTIRCWRRRAFWASYSNEDDLTD